MILEVVQGPGRKRKRLLATTPGHKTGKLMLGPGEVQYPKVVRGDWGLYGRKGWKGRNVTHVGL